MSRLIPDSIARSISQIVAESAPQMPDRFGLHRQQQQIDESVKKAGDVTSDTHKLVQSTIRKSGGVFQGTISNVDHHDDGSSTLHIRHTKPQTDTVVKALRGWREAQGHESKHPAGEALNVSTSAPGTPTIHTKTSPLSGGWYHTQVHFKPIKDLKENLDESSDEHLSQQNVEQHARNWLDAQKRAHKTRNADHQKAADVLFDKYKKVAEHHRSMYPLKEEENLTESTVHTSHDFGRVKETLTGKTHKPGPNGYIVHSGKVTSSVNRSAPREQMGHAVWVQHGDKIIATHNTRDPEVHKKAIEHAKKATHFWDHAGAPEHEKFYLRHRDTPTVLKEEHEQLPDDVDESFDVKHGAFHRWLGKKEDEPITQADIEKGLKAGGHAAKMAEFAKNAKHWVHEDSEPADTEEEDLPSGLDEESNHFDTEDAAKKARDSLVKKHNDNNYSVQPKKNGFKVAHAYYGDKKVGNHLKNLSEESTEDDDLIEEFNTHDQANTRKEYLDKKHPRTMHEVVQGRRSGKYFVVRKSQHGSHVAESVSVPDLESGGATETMKTYDDPTKAIDETAKARRVNKIKSIVHSKE